MPWAHFSLLTLDDLESIYTYVSNVPTGALVDTTTQPLARYCTVATQAADCRGTGETCHVDPIVGNECVGGSCATDDDCGACQHCTGSGSKVCTAPAPSDGCLANGR
jgi:hypothetical protein